MTKPKKTLGAFGNIPEKMAEMLEELLGGLFSPPVEPGDSVAITTLLGVEVIGEVVESTPAGILIKEDADDEIEIFVSSRSIDSMKIDYGQVEAPAAPGPEDAETVEGEPNAEGDSGGV